MLLSAMFERRSYTRLQVGDYQRGPMRPASLAQGLCGARQQTARELMGSRAEARYGSLEMIVGWTPELTLLS